MKFCLKTPTLRPYVTVCKRRDRKRDLRSVPVVMPPPVVVPSPPLVVQGPPRVISTPGETVIVKAKPQVVSVPSEPVYVTQKPKIIYKPAPTQVVWVYPTTPVPTAAPR